MSELESIRKELFGKGRWTFGGDGSHWEGCEETHWDCKLVSLSAENARLTARIAALESESAWITGTNPQESGFYLVYGTTNRISIDYYSEGIWGSRFDVTHWRPLPAAPEVMNE